MIVPRNTYRTGLIRTLNQLLETNKTVAVLMRDAAQAAQLFTTLQLDVAVSLLTEHDHQLHAGCVILPVYLAKGLEFDAVVGFDISAGTYDQPSDADVLYTLASRALHTLILIALDRPSPLIEALPQNLYNTITTANQSTASHAAH